MTRVTIALVALLVAAITFALAGVVINYVGNMRVSTIRAVDGDTVSSSGEATLYRVVGVDTPETGGRAKCPEERALGAKAKARLQQLIVEAENVWLHTVPCSCLPETRGTKDCNGGRLCAQLTADGIDVADILIEEKLARRFICGETSCPRREGWCG